MKIWVLKEICGPKRDEVTGEWRKLHNEELNDLYCSHNIVRVMKSGRMRWVGHLECNGGRRSGYRVLGGDDVKRSFGRPRRRWSLMICTAKPILFES